jgi:hypothetical protein
MYEHLPGGEILDQGLRDLEAGVKSVAALLVRVGAPRLAQNGIHIPAGFTLTQLPEHELYDLLVAQHGPEAYRHYRSLTRRLVSLENAFDSLGAAASEQAANLR